MEKRAKAAVFIPRFGRRSFEIEEISTENDDGLFENFNKSR